MHSRTMIKAVLAFIGCALAIMPASAHDSAFVKAARVASPSVVLIHVEGQPNDGSVPQSAQPSESGQPLDKGLLQQFLGEKPDDAPASAKAARPPGRLAIKRQGSGFVFKAGQHAKPGKTYVLTNDHVISRADKIRVQFKDGRGFDAEVTGRDPQSGVAVLQIDAIGLSALSWGDSSKLEVGEWVLAIGNPFGLNHTLTAGIVSAKGRTGMGINDYEDFIQTDAAVHPGSAGGPLVNLKGRVVGVNTAIFSSGGGYTGIGFAIPSNLASKIAAQLVEEGKATRGYLGIVLQTLTPDLSRSFNVAVESGLLVVQISKDSPAERAGLRQGDVILKLDNETATNVGSFRNRVALMPPDTDIGLTIWRDGARQTLKVKVGRQPTEMQVAR